MELPTLSKWHAGAEHDEEMFNQVSYAQQFLLDPPDCKVQATSTQSINSGTATATAITFHTCPWDNDFMWDAANPTYITIKTSGWFEIEFAVSWATKAADTTLRTAAIYLNGNLALADAIGYSTFINNATTTPQIWQGYDYFFSKDDRVYLGVMQNTGAALSTASHATTKDLQTFLRVRWASL